MHWTDEAIILSGRKHGETSAVVRLFSPEHGVFAGVFKGAHAKANRGIVQPGNIVSATWQARIVDQLGNFKAELLTPYAAYVMQDALKLAALSSACSLVELSLPERHPYARLYKEFKYFLTILADSDHWQEAYVIFELLLLAESGFGLDFSRCAATGTTEDLVYVSPKSGRAVCRDAGAPYGDKMLPLPAFLLPGANKKEPSSAETLAGLRLTGYFLENWLTGPNGKKLPAARQRLITLMKAHDGKDTAKASA